MLTAERTTRTVTVTVRPTAVAIGALVDYTWHHVWPVGDILIWDNRCAMHRRDPFDANARRILHRTQCRGMPIVESGDVEGDARHPREVAWHRPAAAAGPATHAARSSS